MSSIATTSDLSSKTVETQLTKPSDHSGTNNAFDDNPGNLPDDAIESDEPHKQHNVNDGGDKFSDEKSSGIELQTKKEINELQSNIIMAAGNEKLPANKIPENMKSNNGVSSDISNEEKTNQEQLLEDEGIKNPH